MKVLHVAYTWAPDAMGGTEVYVASLCRNLVRDGVTCVVAAPGAADDRAVVDGLCVARFASGTGAQPLDVLYGAGDPVANAAFARLLDAERPDVVHQHALSPACSADLARLAAERRIPVVFTYHTPAVSCQRGTLLFHGRDQCAGAWREDSCTPCVLEGLGVGRPLRAIVDRAPAVIARTAGERGLQGGAWTALRMPMLVQRRLDQVRALFGLVDRVVSLAPWTTDLLVGNGVPPERIVEIAHGVDDADDTNTVRGDTAGAIRFVHLGRSDPSKGTLALLRALGGMPDLAVTLDVYLIGDVAADLREAVARDTRVTLHPPIPHRDVVATMRGCDAVVVPSQIVETGPLVVLEAFAAGVPVIGSRLGGIADKVRHGVDGLLVSPFDDETAWSATLRDCVVDRTLLPRLARGVIGPGGMREIAGVMAGLYAGLAPSAQVAGA